MKKALSLILSVLMILPAFVACTSSSRSEAEAVSESAAAVDSVSAQTENTADPFESADLPETSEENGSGTPPAMPDGSFPGMPGGDAGFGGNPPNGTPPEGFGGFSGNGGTPPNGTPPEGFGGFSGNGGTPPNGTPPEGFSGFNGNGGTPPNGTAPEGFGGFNENGGTSPGGFGGSMDESSSGGTSGGPWGSSSGISYSGATEITSTDTQVNQTYASETADQSALLISTDSAVTVTNPTVTKTGDSDGGDNSNFYGLNAAVLVKDGANVTITGGTITSSASGANGVFCYGGNGGKNGTSGDGTTVTITDTVITTTGSGSGGIMTTGGGVTNANNLTVTTSGQSSAAIRTDRGGGRVYVDGGTYTSNGLGSPAIYSTAEIHVANATLVSNLSEGVCIEGKNSVELVNCDLTANNTKMNSQATFLDSIMIYQSMSGDADSGTSSFTMTGGTLTSKSGHIFHVTNTNAIITLSGVTLVNEDADKILLSVCADGWNGAGNIATLNAVGQVLSGTILVGSDSTLTLNLTESSAFTGGISGSITNAKGTIVSTEVGTVHVTLDSTSTWTLTGDTYVTSFTGDASSIISNGYTLYVGGQALTGTK